MQLLTRNDKKFPSIPTGISIGKYVLSKTSIAKIKRNISSFESRNRFRLAILPVHHISVHKQQTDMNGI